MTTSFWSLALCCFLLACPCRAGSQLSSMSKAPKNELHEGLKQLKSRRGELIEWQEGIEKGVSFSEAEEVLMRNVVLATLREAVSKFIKPGYELGAEYVVEKPLSLPDHTQHMIRATVRYCYSCTKLCKFCTRHDEGEVRQPVPEEEGAILRLDFTASCNKIIEAVEKRYKKEDISSLILSEKDLLLSAYLAADSPHFQFLRPLPFGFVSSRNEWETTVPRFICANFKGVSLWLLVM